MENKEPIIMRGSPVAEHMLSNLTWSPDTVRKYITEGAKDGMCNYNPKYE